MIYYEKWVRKFSGFNNSNYFLGFSIININIIMSSTKQDKIRRSKKQAKEKKLIKENVTEPVKDIVVLNQDGSVRGIIKMT